MERPLAFCEWCVKDIQIILAERMPFFKKAFSRSIVWMKLNCNFADRGGGVMYFRNLWWQMLTNHSTQHLYHSLSDKDTSRQEQKRPNPSYQKF